MTKANVTTLVLINAGYIAELADGTLWRVARGHFPRTREWTAGMTVSVEPKADNLLWSYQLTEVATGVASA
jgi:hypothetical protein